MYRRWPVSALHGSYTFMVWLRRFSLLNRAPLVCLFPLPPFSGLKQNVPARCGEVCPSLRCRRRDPATSDLRGPPGVHTPRQLKPARRVALAARKLPAGNLFWFDGCCAPQKSKNTLRTTPRCCGRARATTQRPTHVRCVGPLCGRARARPQHLWIVLQAFLLFCGRCVCFAFVSLYLWKGFPRKEKVLRETPEINMFLVSVTTLGCCFILRTNNPEICVSLMSP